VEAGELWPFVRGKARVRWVWAALDAGTRQVVAMVVGDRSEGTARRLWAALPAAYRDRAMVCTDFWAAYRAAVPGERHARAGKGAGLTCHVERFWCTLRQRCGRFVRRTLSFSECDRNHVGALWYFVRLHNRSRRCRP
jgi:IS1 family transposase